MKARYKAVAVMLASACFAVSIPSISAASFSGYWGAIAETLAPAGATEVDPAATTLDDDWMSCTVYQTIDRQYRTSVYIVHNYQFNYVHLMMDEADYPAYSACYDQYAQILDYDQYFVHHADGMYQITMYDNLNAAGEISKDPADFTPKQEQVQAFCGTLQEQGIGLIDAVYHSAYAYYTTTGSNSVFAITGVTPGELETLTALIQPCDSYDQSVTTIAGSYAQAMEVILGDEMSDSIREMLQSDMYQDTEYTYRIIGLENLNDRLQVMDAIQQVYPDAEVHEPYFIFYDNADRVTSTEAVDLLTAQPSSDPEPPVATDTTQPDVPTATATTGDLDGDGAITIQDAYQTLMAYANASAGLEDGLTEAQRKAVDVDGDGAVTIQDAYKILRYYADASAGLEPSWE